MVFEFVKLDKERGPGRGGIQARGLGGEIKPPCGGFYLFIAVSYGVNLSAYILYDAKKF